jgi:hypothetical protein
VRNQWATILQSIIEQFTPERWSGECGGQSVENQVNTPVAGDSEYCIDCFGFGDGKRVDRCADDENSGLVRRLFRKLLNYLRQK